MLSAGSSVADNASRYAPTAPASPVAISMSARNASSGPRSGSRTSVRTASINDNASRYAPMAASVRAACSRIGAAAADIARLQQLVADPRRGCAEAAQRLGRATMQRQQPVRRQAVEQSVPDERSAGSGSQLPFARSTPPASASSRSAYACASPTPATATYSSVSNSAPNTATLVKAEMVASPRPRSTRAPRRTTSIVAGRGRAGQLDRRERVAAGKLHDAFEKHPVLADGAARQPPDVFVGELTEIEVAPTCHDRSDFDASRPWPVAAAMAGARRRSESARRPRRATDSATAAGSPRRRRGHRPR
mgnify:CR=1 FL=1